MRVCFISNNYYVVMISSYLPVEVCCCYFEIFIFLESLCGFTNDSERQWQHFHQNFFKFLIALQFGLVNLREDEFFFVDVKFRMVGYALMKTYDLLIDEFQFGVDVVLNFGGFVSQFIIGN